MSSDVQRRTFQSNAFDGTMTALARAGADVASDLTELKVRNARAQATRYRLTDAHGLYLLVLTQGGRHWRFDYRFNRLRRTLTIGSYPLISLRRAREVRDEARRLLKTGVDPVNQQRLAAVEEKIKAQATFASVADELITKMERERRAEATLRKTRWLIDFARPALGPRPIAEISAPEVLLVLRTLETRGRYESAKRLRSVIGQVFRYAIATARAQSDPTYALKDALTSPPVRHYAAITDEDRAGELLAAIETFAGMPATHAALRLAPHLFVRPGELRSAEWCEFDFERAVWNIPAPKTKMRRPLKAPLTRQTLSIIMELRQLTGRGRYLFPSQSSDARAMSDNCLNAALRRLGFDNTEMTAHGFRAMACSLLNESGLWHPDAIERQLGHCDANDVRRAYARAEFWDERVRMMHWWSNRIDTLKSAHALTSRSKARLAATRPSPSADRENRLSLPD